MGNHLKSQFGNRAGFGMTEVIIGSGILVVIATVMFTFLINQSSRMVTLSSVNSCDEIATSILDSIKNHDNSTIVRSWFPQIATGFGALNVNDPYCKNTNLRTPVCDATQIVFNQVASPYVDFNNLKNHLNVRGAFVWAQDVYNGNNPAICNGQGLTLTSAQLGNLLPTQIALPTWVSDYRLLIQDANMPLCNATDSVSPNAKYTVKLTVRYQRTNTPEGQNSACTKEVALSHHKDISPPTTSVVQVANTSGDVIPPPTVFGGFRKVYCTDPRTPAQFGNPAPAWRDLDISLSASEPGSLLLCRKRGLFPGETDDGPVEWRNCADLVPSSGTASVTPGPAEAAQIFGAAPAPVLSLRTLADDGGPMVATPHIFEFMTVDVSGNRSLPQPAEFHVHQPTCPPQGDYCPNAVDAGTLYPARRYGPYSISTRPWDSCDNGVCPVGNHSWCDPAEAAAICSGVGFNDDCGLPNCTGTFGGDCSGVPAANTVVCGVPLYGSCGRNCGAGTIPDCVGADPSSVDCCEDVPGRCGAVGCGIGTRNCAVDDPLTVGIDETQVCGAGPPGPPIVPPPVPKADASGALPQLHCDRNGAFKSCSVAFYSGGFGIPIDYLWYSLVVNVHGHRHGGNSLIKVWVQMWGTGGVWGSTPPNYNTDLYQCRGPMCGPEFGNLWGPAPHPFRPMWNWETVTVGRGSAVFNIIVEVDDAEAWVDMTWRASDVTLP